jgi:GNAT superfamily N-acetyltransferase
MEIEPIYEKANILDLDRIFGIYTRAVEGMNAAGIAQWDELYPTIDIIHSDIAKGELTTVRIGSDIAAVFVINNECDEQYQNGCWQGNASGYSVIHRLCVDPKYQNRGLAKTIMMHIEQVLHAANCESVRLDAFSRNPYALRLYTALGYKTVGEVRWRKGLFYLMEKIL